MWRCCFSRLLHSSSNGQADFSSQQRSHLEILLANDCRYWQEHSRVVAEPNGCSMILGWSVAMMALVPMLYLQPCYKLFMNIPEILLGEV